MDQKIFPKKGPPHSSLIEMEIRGMDRRRRPSLNPSSLLSSSPLGMDFDGGFASRSYMGQQAVQEVFRFLFFLNFVDLRAIA